MGVNCGVFSGEGKGMEMFNVGSLDRMVRLIIGLALIVIPFVPAFAARFVGIGPWVWVMPVAGAILVLTAVSRFCPAYYLFGVRTCATR